MRNSQKEKKKKKDLKHHTEALEVIMVKETSSSEYLSLKTRPGRARQEAM